jgi:replication initiation protein RepC
MESINCATATGRRRLSLKEIAAKEKINGIYKENTTKGRVLAAFKRAAIPMGIGRGVVNLIDTLFAWSEPQDWQAGELCVVWPSNETLQRSLQLSVSRLKTLRRLAVEDGLIFMRESPNGHRGGYRENGQIVEAFGFDLSPLAARQAEFEAIAKADEERHREGKRLRRQIGSLRARVLSLIDLARLVAMDSDDWEATIEKAEAIYRLRGKSCDPIHLRPLKKGLDE